MYNFCKQGFAWESTAHVLTFTIKALAWESTVHLQAFTNEGVLLRVRYIYKLFTGSILLEKHGTCIIFISKGLPESK